MAFGGAGFAISYPRAKVLAKVFDSCIERHPHLYRIQSLRLLVRNICLEFGKYWKQHVPINELMTIPPPPPALSAGEILAYLNVAIAIALVWL
ncbi:hypothetical protein V6N13_046740 [Hibiscus sabdariffa]